MVNLIFEVDGKHLFKYTKLNGLHTPGFCSSHLSFPSLRTLTTIMPKVVNTSSTISWEFFQILFEIEYFSLGLIKK